MSAPWISFAIVLFDILLFVTLCLAITLLEMRQVRIEVETDRAAQIETLRLRNKLLTIV
jgi:hypothetical protein